MVVYQLPPVRLSREDVCGDELGALHALNTDDEALVPLGERSRLGILNCRGVLTPKDCPPARDYFLTPVQRVPSGVHASY